MPQKRTFASGDTLPFRGEEFTLRVVEHDGRRTKITIAENELLVYIHRSLPPAMHNKEISTRLEQWYKRMARETFTEIAEYFKTRLGVDYNALRIKEQKTRWGSCSQKGNLNFNWKLVMAPIEIIDYVVVHELCHLVHMNHAKDFWRLVEGQLPDYQQRKRWLKENGAKLKL